MSTISSKAPVVAAAMAATGLALVAPPLCADTPAADTAASDEQAPQEVIVTGTRQKGMEAAESPTPIQIIGAGELKATGQPNLINALAQLVPSFVAQASGGDMSNQTLQARLRGVSPNDVLVLVDGKRRHTTANVAVLSGPYQGGAGADLNFIPVDAIDHVEVLTEGAAAQYGSDAIVGVINIILKRNSSGGEEAISTAGATRPKSVQTRAFSPCRNRSSTSPRRSTTMAAPSGPTSIRALPTRTMSIRPKAARIPSPTCRSRPAIPTLPGEGPTPKRTVKWRPTMPDFAFSTACSSIAPAATAGRRPSPMRAFDCPT
jgi:outer membrane receptor protein involved in Fe transport